MAIMRVVKDKNYSVVHNGFILDKTISLKAKALLLYCLSRPNDWNFYTSEITSNCTDGFKSVTAGIKELINAGYIVRIRRKANKNCRNGCFEYFIYETPVKGNDSTDKAQDIEKVEKIKEIKNKDNHSDKNLDIISKEINEENINCQKVNGQNVNYQKVNGQKVNGENVNYQNVNGEKGTLLNTDNILSTNNILNTEALINTDKELNTKYVQNTSPPPPNTKEDVINKYKVNTSGVGGVGKNDDIYNLFYEAGFGEVNKVIKEIIDYNILKYSKEAFYEATIESIKNNKLKLSYIEGILKNNEAKRGKGYGKSNGDNREGRCENSFRESGLYLDLEDLL